MSCWVCTTTRTRVSCTPLTYYYTDTLGYKNFDLVYKTNENTDYGRPGTTWGIGSYRMDGSPSGEGNKEGVLNEDGSPDPRAGEDDLRR